MSVHCHVYLYLSFRGLPPLNILLIVSATFPVLFCLFYILFSSYVVDLKLRECILVIRLAEPTETVHWSFWKSKFTFWVCVCVYAGGRGFGGEMHLQLWELLESLCFAMWILTKLSDFSNTLYWLIFTELGSPFFWMSLRNRLWEFFILQLQWKYRQYRN